MTPLPHVISDELWLTANLEPATYRSTLGIQIPDVPPDDIQRRFTGRAGRVNLEQAFAFYRIVLAHLPIEKRGRYRLMDFGGGWGRILRLFLREVPPDSLLLCDCLTDAIETARSLNPPYAVYHNDPEPPIRLAPLTADCIYAFSVFSHLRESLARAWLRHFAELLVPGGSVVLTTRGQVQIGIIRQMSGRRWFASVRQRVARLRRTTDVNAYLPSPSALSRRYAEGRFQFYPTGGGGELTTEFYGEAWIPERWIQENFAALGFSRYTFATETPEVDQCIIVLTK
jgi:hypothetical protein